MQDFRIVFCMYYEARRLLRMEHLADEELVALCLKGQKEAYNVLVVRYQSRIYSLAYRLGGDYDEARDLAQEAFIRIYQELPQFDASRKFFPWMYRVARNTCINYLQKRSRAVPAEEAIEDLATMAAHNPDYNPEQRLEKSVVTDQIRQAILSMPEKYALPVMLKYIEGLSYQEIGKALDLPQSTVETRLFRGRQALQKKLADLHTKKTK